MSEPIEVQVESDSITVKCLHAYLTLDAATKLASLVVAEIQTSKKVILDLLLCEQSEVGAFEALSETILHHSSAISPGGVLLLGGDTVVSKIKELNLGPLFACLKSRGEALRLIEVTGKIEYFLGKVSDALISTFTASLGMAPRPETPYFRKLPTEIGLMAATKVSSRYFEGTLSLAFPQKTFLAIMSRMFATEFSEIGEEIADGAAELSNILIGQLKTSLNDATFDLKIGMPSSMKDERMRLFQSKFPPLFIKPYTSDCGGFIVLLSVSSPPLF